MASLSDLVVLDSNSLTYLARAFELTFDPTEPDVPCADESVALFRIHLHLDSVASLVPEVEAEYESIRDKQLRRGHSLIAAIALLDPPPGLAEAAEDRACELWRHHASIADCRVVAQAEVLQADALLTSDAKMRRRLAPLAKIEVCTASQYWVALQVPHGHQPRSVPVLPRGAVKPRSWGWWEW